MYRRKYICPLTLFMVYSLMCRVICNEEIVVLSNTDLFVCTQHKNHCLDQWSEFGAGLSVYWPMTDGVSVQETCLKTFVDSESTHFTFKMYDWKK